MADNIYRSIEEPNRKGLTRDVLWKGSDDGLIACWERGRMRAEDSQELA